MQKLFDYVQGLADFPDSALCVAGVSMDGKSFIRDCMDPKPSSRPSATFASERMAWQANVHNHFDGWKAIHVGTLQCEGTDPPFLLFTPAGGHLIVITRYKIYLWNINTLQVVSTCLSTMGQEWVHGSVYGGFLCVTEAYASQPPEIRDASTLELVKSPDDLLRDGTAPKISTFSHDGMWLVIASDDMLCQISLRTGWKVVNTYRGAMTPSSRMSVAKRIKSMAFTKDSKRLVAAYENKVVIKDTSTAHWCNVQVFDYPCPLNCVSVSPGGTLVACGSSTGVVWLWSSDTNCWKKRAMPSGGPDKIQPPIENLEFSGTGLSMTFTYGENTEVSLVKTVPFDETGVSWDLYRPYGHRVGRTATAPKHMHGATPAVERRADVSQGLAANVTFWRYKV